MSVNSTEDPKPAPDRLPSDDQVAAWGLRDGLAALEHFAADEALPDSIRRKAARAAVLTYEIISHRKQAALEATVEALKRGGGE